MELNELIQLQYVFIDVCQNLHTIFEDASIWMNLIITTHLWSITNNSIHKYLFALNGFQIDNHFSMD